MLLQDEDRPACCRAPHCLKSCVSAVFDARNGVMHKGVPAQRTRGRGNRTFVLFFVLGR